MANIYFILSLILSISTLQTNAQDEKELQSRLFGSSPANITPEDTLLQLKQLNSILMRENSTSNVSEIKDLINLSNVTSNTCNCGEVEEYRYQKSIHSQQPTIVAYLENYAHRRFNACQDSYVKELNETVATIDPQDAQALANLTSEVDKILYLDENYFLYASDQAIAQGVNNYVRNMPGTFKEKYFDQVKSLCQRVLPILRTQMRGHYNLVCQQESTWPTDPTRGQWMQSGWLCNALIETEHRILPWIQYYRFLRA